MEQHFTDRELEFVIRLAACLVCGMVIGLERESRGKPAGISTHCFVIGGAMLFTHLSAVADPNNPARVAAQIVSGVGFLGAGMILKGEGKGSVTNLTTAAAVWFAAALGMAIGFGWYVIAATCTLYSVIVPRIPHLSKWGKEQDP
jgi:putative Mg2+ transporter-C (MgtC) family protein